MSTQVVKPLSVPPKRLAASIISADTTFQPSNILSWVDKTDLTAADFGDQAYGCFRDVNGTVLELFEFDPTTIANAEITILRRGLKFDGNRTTQVAANKLNWVKGTTIVELGTTMPQFFQWLKEYIDAASIAGAVPAGIATLGIVRISVAAANASIPIAVGDNDPRIPQNGYAASAVGTDAYAINPSSAVTAYAAGQMFSFKADVGNTGVATLNVSALGAKTIKKNGTLDLATGDIAAGQIVTVRYDGTNFQLQSAGAAIPTSQTFDAVSVTRGDTTTQFTITNPAGTTFRYTFTGTGTDPGITAITFPVGTPVMIEASTMTAANTGSFIVTGSGANFFEITNASGVAEATKLLTNGYLISVTLQTYTAPIGLKYAIVEVQAAGGGAVGTATNQNAGTRGGPGGGYGKKTVTAATIGTTQSLWVAPASPSAGAVSNDLNFAGGPAIFGTLISATGGIKLIGGTVTGADFSIPGGTPEPGSTTRSGRGGDSFWGQGGPPVSIDNNGIASTGYGSGGSGAFGDSSSSASSPGASKPARIVVTEYYA